MTKMLKRNGPSGLNHLFPFKKSRNYKSELEDIVYKHIVKRKQQQDVDLIEMPDNLLAEAKLLQVMI